MSRFQCPNRQATTAEIWPLSVEHVHDTFFLHCSASTLLVALIWELCMTRTPSLRRMKCFNFHVFALSRFVCRLTNRVSQIISRLTLEAYCIARLPCITIIQSPGLAWSFSPFLVHNPPITGSTLELRTQAREPLPSAITTDDDLNPPA